MPRGGKREGAGKKPGSKHKATLEKIRVAEAFNQRVMNAADALFNAQLTLATGSMKVFRIDEEITESGKVKRVHVHITDPDEIKALLDEHDGSAGVVKDKYYYFSEVLPDNRAIDSLLNRALGKAPEKIIVASEEADAAIDAAIEAHGLPRPETFHSEPVVGREM